VKIRRGYFSKEEHRISRENIADVQVVLPIVLRSFHVGFVRILTNDGLSYSLKNVKNPGEIAESIG
jgi:uncharacterized membrane protein YdbT with pleckstrin-like domain